VWSGVETARPIIEKLESPATQGLPRDPRSRSPDPARLLVSRLRARPRRPSCRRRPRRRLRLRGSPAIGARKRALLLVDLELIKADLRAG